MVVRRAAGYVCFGLSGYLAFAVLEHLTGLVGAGLLWWRE